jgi:hypothetical protein
MDIVIKMPIIKNRIILLLRKTITQTKSMKLKDFVGRIKFGVCYGINSKMIPLYLDEYSHSEQVYKRSAERIFFLFEYQRN